MNSSLTFVTGGTDGSIRATGMLNYRFIISDKDAAFIQIVEIIGEYNNYISWSKILVSFYRGIIEKHPVSKASKTDIVC